MSNTSKAAVIIVIVLVLGGIIWAMSKSSGSQSNTAANAPAVPAESVASSTASVAAAPDTSDASINSDLSAVDSQIGSLSVDNANTAKASANQ